MNHWTSAGIPFVPVLWVLKSSVSVSTKIRLGTPDVRVGFFFSIADKVYGDFDLTAVVATVCARTEEPPAKDYPEGMGQREDDA